MPIYIVTWNPRRWNWDEADFNGKVERTRQGELVPDRWSCGNTRRIVGGDRLFLLRQGVDRGMVGAGYATGGPVLDTRWDEMRRDEQAFYVDLQFDTLLPVENQPTSFQFSEHGEVSAVT